MNNIFFEDVQSYLVFLYGGPNGNGGADASISLSVPAATVFLRFFADGFNVPSNSTVTAQSGQKLYYANYRYDQLQNVIDVLRSEKPIKFFFHQVTNAAYVTTGQEPIGEDE